MAYCVYYIICVLISHLDVFKCIKQFCISALTCIQWLCFRGSAEEVAKKVSEFRAMLIEKEQAGQLAASLAKDKFGRPM